MSLIHGWMMLLRLELSGAAKDLDLKSSCVLHAPSAILAGVTGTISHRAQSPGLRRAG